MAELIKIPFKNDLEKIAVEKKAAQEKLKKEGEEYARQRALQKRENDEKKADEMNEWFSNPDRSEKSPTFHRYDCSDEFVDTLIKMGVESDFVLHEETSMVKIYHFSMK